MDSITSLILKDKREAREEFFINLFELCNLKCSFCWQDHNDKRGMDTVRDKAQVIIDRLIERKKYTNGFDINLMGGELFFDEINDSLFDDYFYLAKKVNEYCTANSIEVSFNWVTNLVFTKTQRVLKLQSDLIDEGVDSMLTTSYDPRGRFNTKNFNLFLKNIDIVRMHLRSVGIVMTRPNIMAIMKGDSKLQSLYKKIDLYFDYYSPEESFKTSLPKDSELLVFFKYMLQNYPKAEPFRSWRENDINKMTCRSSNVILPDGGGGKCRSLVAKSLYDEFLSEFDVKDNDSMEKSFIERRNCLTCEFFQKCGLGCFLQSDFLKHNDLEDCLFYLTFKEIQGEEV